MALLEVRDLKTYYRLRGGTVRAVDGVSLVVERGTMVGVVGESGCGKTTVGRSLLRVLPRNAYIAGGQIVFQGRDLVPLPERELRRIRWTEIAMVPQSAMDSLDPVYRVEDQMLEVLVGRGGLTRREGRRRAAELFEMVGLDAGRMRQYPHQFSGGMKQRVAIAMALALSPDLLIADEPVTALDVIVQDQILTTLKRLQQELHIAVIMITHDISVVAQTCDYVAVMYAGRVVEFGTTRDVLKKPFHPYTLGLQNAFPDLFAPEDRLVSIPGHPPDLSRPLRGCRFAQRCPFATAECLQEEPEPLEVEPGHTVACLHAGSVDDMRARAREVETWQQVPAS